MTHNNDLSHLFFFHTSILTCIFIEYNRNMNEQPHLHSSLLQKLHHKIRSIYSSSSSFHHFSFSTLPRPNVQNNGQYIILTDGPSVKRTNLLNHQKHFAAFALDCASLAVNNNIVTIDNPCQLTHRYLVARILDPRHYLR